jgi:hypothetical protein
MAQIESIGSGTLVRAYVRPLVNLQMTNTNRPIEVIRHWRDNGMLVLSPPYQRGDVWGGKRRVNLIRSILLGVPIPSIVVNDRIRGEWGDDDLHYAVIDGKQRCTTILMFFDDKLAIPGGWMEIDKSEVVFSELPIPKQRRFKNQAIGFCEGALRTLEAEQEVFELINFGGVAQGENDQ